MSPEQTRSALLHFAQIRRLLEEKPRGLMTDVDGTISEIASTPELATITTACHRYLQALVCRFDLVAVVSGRPVSEIKCMVELDGVTYVGNHGLECWHDGQLQVEPDAKSAARALPELREEVRNRLGESTGLRLEHKTYGLAIHYRSAPNPQTARQSILRAVADLPDFLPFSITEGRRVVEFRPQGRVNKGWALRTLIRRHGLRSAIYLGDDLTDVDAFRAIKGLRRRHIISGVAVAVVGDETIPAVVDGADVTLRGVAEVETFLSKLSG